MWHRWSQETDRQTDRGRKRWAVVSHGERGVSRSGQRHYSNRRYTFFPIIHDCGCSGALCQSIVLFFFCFVFFLKIWCKAVIYTEDFRECWDCGPMSTLLDCMWHACVVHLHWLSFYLSNRTYLTLPYFNTAFLLLCASCLSFLFCSSFVICSCSPALVSMHVAAKAHWSALFFLVHAIFPLLPTETYLLAFLFC